MFLGDCPGAGAACEGWHNHVNGHRNPDVGLQRIGAGAELVFDTERILNPLEKEFYLPTALAELRHSESRDLQVICEDDEMFDRLLALHAV